MDEYSITKVIDKGSLPESVVFNDPKLYEKGRLIKEGDPFAVYGAKPEAGSDQPDLCTVVVEEKSRQVVPSTIWTAGILYYTYFNGEVMRLFDVADILVTRWTQGKLVVTDDRTLSALDRLLKKRERRICSEERDLLYKRVFNFGRVEKDSYVIFNEAFPTDWNRLMKGVAAYPKNPTQEHSQTEWEARERIYQATCDLQVHLSEAMAGTAYMMAAEVFTLLREATDLLRCDEVIQAYGAPGLGMNSVIEHIVAEEFNELLSFDLLSQIASSGSRILQEWVAKYQAQSCEGPLPQILLDDAQDWRYANCQLAAL